MYKICRVIKKTVILLFVFNVVLCLFFCIGYVKPAECMPFYNLSPQDIVCRSTFYTSYSTSSEERKSNIALATSTLNNTLVDAGAEFSFNRTVGARTEKNGYKLAKIIVGGEFVDGVGGGVCQVSTTLYNAILLAGLNVTEYHPHSLRVSYVAPSFDAMVNSGSADLRFINDTSNPIIIKAIADGDKLKIEIWGEPLKEKISRQSVVTGEIPAPPEREIQDELGEYPELYQGEKLVVKYSKAGLKSDGYIVSSINGKIVSIKKIRSDKYGAQRGVIVLGTAIKPENPSIEEQSEQILDIDNYFFKI